MTTTEIIGRLDYLTQTNPIIKQCWQKMIANNLSYEQFLQLCVVLLGDENEMIRDEMESLSTALEDECV